MRLTTPSPAAGSELDQILREFARYCTVSGMPFGTTLNDTDKFDETLAAIKSLITTQNDATYAKVMEEIEHAETITDLRQSIAKIFGKADAKPEER